MTQATAMVVGTIIGSSIFVQPSEVSKAVPTFSGVLLVWTAAGALTWFGASICAELSSAYPKTGGVYVFLREMFPPAAGFLWGWAMFWSMHSGIIAAIAIVFGRYFATILPLNDWGIRLVAVADGDRRDAAATSRPPGKTPTSPSTAFSQVFVRLRALLRA